MMILAKYMELSITLSRRSSTMLLLIVNKQSKSVPRFSIPGSHPITWLINKVVGLLRLGVGLFYQQGRFRFQKITKVLADQIDMQLECNLAKDSP